MHPIACHHGQAMGCLLWAFDEGGGGGGGGGGGVSGYISVFLVEHNVWSSFSKQYSWIDIHDVLCLSFQY